MSIDLVDRNPNGARQRVLGLSPCHGVTCVDKGDAFSAIEHLLRLSCTHGCGFHHILLFDQLRQNIVF